MKSFVVEELVVREIPVGSKRFPGHLRLSDHVQYTKNLAILNLFVPLSAVHISFIWRCIRM